MNMVHKAFATMILAALPAALPAQEPVPIPANGCYHAVFTTRGQEQFEAGARKPVAIQMMYKKFAFDAHFPAAECEAMVTQGAIPHITWEPWDGDMNHPYYNNQSIIDGAYDAYILTWARGIKTWGKPVMLRWGHEMNGDWYPWDGMHSGGATATQFGDSGKADGPERYVAAYRRIHRLFDSVGVTNVAWIWSPNAASFPAASWNAADQYYPGDDVVDWIGLDGYNFGTSQSWSSWVPFFQIFKDSYNTFRAYGKPMMIAEFASSELGGYKPQWISDAFLYIKGFFRNVKAVTWFDINKETDWRIDSSPASLQAYRSAIADPYFLGSAAALAAPDAAGRPGAEFALSPAYPNPFNGSTRLTCQVVERGEYAMAVHTVLGQQVRILFTGMLAPGMHAMEWDGLTAHGRRASSGMYIVSLTSRTARAVQRVILAQ